MSLHECPNCLDVVCKCGFRDREDYYTSLANTLFKLMEKLNPHYVLLELSNPGAGAKQYPDYEFSVQAKLLTIHINRVIVGKHRSGIISKLISAYLLYKKEEELKINDEWNREVGKAIRHMKFYGD